MEHRRNQATIGGGMKNNRKKQSPEVLEDEGAFEDEKLTKSVNQDCNTLESFVGVNCGDEYIIEIGRGIVERFGLLPSDCVNQSDLFTSDSPDYDGLRDHLAHALAAVFMADDNILKLYRWLYANNYLSCSAHRSTHLGAGSQTPSTLQPISDHLFKLKKRRESPDRPFASSRTEEYFLTPFLRAVVDQAFDLLKQQST